MNYSRLFDTLYSESISEDVKELVVERVLDEAVMKDVDFLEESIHESNSKVLAYQEALSYLVNSNISEEVMMETLDLMFANESEEVIGQVEEAFKEDVAKGILVSTLMEDHMSIWRDKNSDNKDKGDFAKRAVDDMVSKKGLHLGEVGAPKKVENKQEQPKQSALGKLKDSVKKVFSKKESKSTDIGKGDGSFRSKEPTKVEMNKGTGEFRGKSKGPAPVGLAALRRAHGEEPIQKTEPKKETETPKSTVSFQDDFAGKIKGAAEERKEKVKRGEGSVRTGSNVSDSSFNVAKINKENKEMADKAKEKRRLEGVDDAISKLRKQIEDYTNKIGGTPSVGQTRHLTMLKNKLTKITSTNESLKTLSAFLTSSEVLMCKIFEMLKPNYDAVLKRDEEEGAKLAEPRVIGNLVVKPEENREKQNEIATHHEKVQARKAKYNK